MSAGRRREWLVSLVTSGICIGAMLCASPGSAAGAGRYHVYSCRMPDGQAAPVDGWSPSASGVAVYAEDKCSKGGALVAALGDGVTHEVGTEHATWMLAAPAETVLAAATLWRAGDADGGWATNATYEFWLAGPNDEDVKADTFDQCVAEFGCPTGVGDTSNIWSTSNLVSILPEYLGTHLYVNSSCGGTATYICPSSKGDPNGYAAVVYLYAADLVLEQVSAPKLVGPVSGELASASTLSGSANVMFEASDSGSGVYQAIVSVDGKALGATALDSNGGHCANVGQTTDGLPAFLYLQPCAATVSADVSLDTTQLTDGEHRVVVEASDAAGNRTVVLDRKVTVRNHPVKEEPSPSGGSTSGSSGAGGSGTSGSGAVSSVASGGSGSSSTSGSSASTPGPSGVANGAGATPAVLLSAQWLGTSSQTIRSRYGRPATIAGRLISQSGSPIVGALIEATAIPSDAGAHSAALAAVRTAADGTFRVRLAKWTPSSEIALSYRSTLTSPVPSATATLRVVVPASLTLHVGPRVSSVGGTLRFSGVVRGGHIPRGGKQIVLQASSPRERWRTFEALTTDRRGRFHATYRLRYPGPASYRFRAVSPAEADFPFAAGASNVVGVRER
jgi:hypothetical protein